MFEIALSCRFTALNGLNALDKARELGLPDTVRLVTVSREPVVFTVSEAVAREYFKRDEIINVAKIDLDLCRKGDLEVHEINGNEMKVVLARDLPIDRALELYIETCTRYPD